MSYGLFNWWWGEKPKWEFLENLKITSVANQENGGTTELNSGGSTNKYGFDNRIVGKSLEWLRRNEWVGERYLPESMIAPFQKHPCLIFYDRLGFDGDNVYIPSFLDMTDKEFFEAFYFVIGDGWWILKDMDLNQAIAETLKKNSPELYQKFQDYEVKS